MLSPKFAKAGRISSTSSSAILMEYGLRLSKMTDLLTQDRPSIWADISVVGRTGIEGCHGVPQRCTCPRSLRALSPPTSSLRLAQRDSASHGGYAVRIVA